MKILILTFFVSLACFSASAQKFSWVKQLGGVTDDYSSGIAIDSSGNLLITGQFTGTADFDPGPDTSNMTSFGLNDIFVCKFDPAGNLLWAKQMGGASADAGSAIAIDPSGNVYITGNFSGTADMDPGAGVFNISSKGGLDIFIAKLDPSGNFLWSASFGDVTDDDHGNSIAVDASGNVFTTGNFKGTIDFDPGASTASLTADYIDVFVSKLDASGNYVWAKKMGGLSYDYGYGITVDASGYVYITGAFRTLNCDYDPGPGIFYLSTYADTEEFIVKLNAAGGLVWAKQTNTGAYNYSNGFAIAVDASGNVYTTGSFKGTADFDPGPGTANLVAGGLNDGFALKLNSNGDFVWVKQIGGCQIEDYGTSIKLDDSANVYIVGVFQYIADFDPGPGTFELHSQGGTDVYVCKLNSGGYFLWAGQFGGGSSDYGSSIAIDGSGNIYTTGHFQVWSDFDPGPGENDLVTFGGYDAFVDKLRQGPAPLEQPILSAVAAEYCSALGPQKIKLTNFPDTTEISVSITLDTNVLALSADSSISLPVNSLTAGLHHLEVKYSNATENKTLTKDFNVVAAVTPDVNVSADVTTVTDLVHAILTATNTTGGGSAPLFAFGKDKNMTTSLLLQAESPDNTLNLDPANLTVGANRIYVRMRTSESCFTIATAIDSIDITKSTATSIIDIDFPGNNIYVYPVPFDRTFYVKGLQISKSYSISLTNSMGQTVFQKRVQNSSEINITTNFSAGNYWLTIYDETKKRLLGVIAVVKK
jgi:beta-propeller repeat-containing protein/type IX secretion system substrate protein